MGSDSGGRDYSLTEIFAIKFVLADILIIAVLLLAGPLYALAITALFLLSTFLIWYLMQRESQPTNDGTETDPTTTARRAAAERDPVTKLQDRYAAGELTDDEFEAKLERLIESNETATAAGIDTEDLELEHSN